MSMRYDGRQNRIVFSLCGLDQQRVGLQHRSDADIAVTHKETAILLTLLAGCCGCMSRRRFALKSETEPTWTGSSPGASVPCGVFVVGVPGSPPNNCCQVAGKDRRFKIFDAVNIELFARPGRATIQDLDPFFSLVQVFFLESYHHD